MSAPTVRGRALPLATYRRRRRQALRLVTRAADHELPLLLLGVPEHDPVVDRNPSAGRARQDPWFDWFCGCHEPDAALLIDPHARQVVTLFIDPGKPERVVWDGPRLAPGPATARLFGVDACLPIDALPKSVQAAAARHGHRLGLFWREREPGHQSAAAHLWRKKLKGVTVFNAEPAITPLRMVKDADEITCHRRAIARTAAGLAGIFRRIPRLRHEAAIAACLNEAYAGERYEVPAFAPIVGSGVHGATLHYKHNDGPLLRRQPVLIDSGARCDGYCADVTRTVPQHGRFDNRRFRDVYELVLAANARTRRAARPGVTLAELNAVCWEPIIAAGFTRHHGVSHHIGLDVHDPADYNAPLAPGMIISNEPGIYLPDEGFGIRIEDDLLITKDGCEELTRAIPKTIAAVERAMVG
jgi:Xaa-Pro aminopeptidase